ncbi:MAG: tRNA-binding protein [Nanoarchaeota archaeon]
MTTINDFQKIDIRAGEIIEIEDFPESKNPSYKLKINFGKDIGIKKSCAQLVKTYSKKELKNKIILGVVNFPPRQIGPAISEVLVLGLPDENNNCILIKPDKDVKVGVKIY